MVEGEKKKRLGRGEKKKNKGYRLIVVGKKVCVPLLVISRNKHTARWNPKPGKKGERIVLF